MTKDLILIQPRDILCKRDQVPDNLRPHLAKTEQLKVELRSIAACKGLRSWGPKYKNVKSCQPV